MSGGGNGYGYGHGYNSGSGSGSEREPSEERGHAPWAWAPTQTALVLPPPAPPPRPRDGVRRLLLVFAVAVAVGIGVGVGVWFLIRDTSTGPGAGPDPAPSVTVSSPSTVSPGYRRAQDPVGYSLDVPEGWTRTQKQGRLAPVVSYDAPADGRRLQIFRLAEATPARSLDLAETHPAYGFARQPGYRPLDRDSGPTWSELSYRYTDTDTGPRQVIDHRFESADGTLYAIRAGGPETLAPASVRDPLTRALASFAP